MALNDNRATLPISSGAAAEADDFLADLLPSTRATLAASLGALRDLDAAVADAARSFERPSNDLRTTQDRAAPSNDAASRLGAAPDAASFEGAARSWVCLLYTSDAADE